MLVIICDVKYFFKTKIKWKKALFLRKVNLLMFYVNSYSFYKYSLVNLKNFTQNELAPNSSIEKIIDKPID